MTAPPDDSGNKNVIQAFGSCTTYLMRYTLVPALGLVTADEDTDGRPTRKGPARYEDQPKPPPPVPADWPPASSVGAKSAPAASQPASEDGDARALIADLVLRGEKVRGHVKEIAPKQYWKKQPGGAMKKTFELEEYPGLKWTTLSNPEDATHPWGVGTEVWFEAGTNEDGSVNLWDWKTKTYGNAESVRPVPPADDVQDGEIVEEPAPTPDETTPLRSAILDWQQGFAEIGTLGKTEWTRIVKEHLGTTNVEACADMSSLAACKQALAEAYAAEKL